jgi:hypothetical protein
VSPDPSSFPAGFRTETALHAYQIGADAQLAFHVAGRLSVAVAKPAKMTIVGPTVAGLP